MQCGISSGSSLFAKVSVYGFPVIKGLITDKKGYFVTLLCRHSIRVCSIFSSGTEIHNFIDFDQQSFKIQDELFYINVSDNLVNYLISYEIPLKTLGFKEITFFFRDLFSS